MLYRKIEKSIVEHLESDSRIIMIVDGARSVGKTFTVRQAAKKVYGEFIEINMLEDSVDKKHFAESMSVDEFIFRLNMVAPKINSKKFRKLVFIDEIQAYPYLLTLLKFLSENDEYRFICSGSLLGVTLQKTTSIPMGATRFIRMFPLDFEEFLIANNIGENAILKFKQYFNDSRSLDDSIHNTLMDKFKKYLMVGGLPLAVDTFIKTNDVKLVRDVQSDVFESYKIDASQYDQKDKLNIRKIYQMIPSLMENKKKRIKYKDIENKEDARFLQYANDFEYIISAGIAVSVQAVSNPEFPLTSTATRNIFKLYMNDVGLLTNVLFKNNYFPIIDSTASINLGSLYETIVATELNTHNHKMYYYDNKYKGEVDFLIDDHQTLSVLPIEVKSGKNYTKHSALNNLKNTPNYNVKKAYVFSNEKEIVVKDKVIYAPIYNIMFL